MSADFVPFGMSDEEVDDYRVLVDGVPSWMLEPLIAWLCTNGLSTVYDEPIWKSPAAWLAAQVALRMDLGVSATTGELDLHHDTLAKRLRSKSHIELLRLADYWANRSGALDSPRNRALAAVLAASGSKWTVGVRNERSGLVERVPDGVQATVETTIDSSGTAGQILRRAWAHVYGIVPNDSAAYSDAVRAVEIAASTVVVPGDTTATLGKRLGQMKADGDWRLDLREHKDAPSADMLLMMIRTLWYGHRDRHGSVDYTDVAHAEATEAVLLASTLVGWFAAGAIQRRAT